MSKIITTDMSYAKAVKEMVFSLFTTTLKILNTVNNVAETTENIANVGVIMSGNFEKTSEIASTLAMVEAENELAVRAKDLGVDLTTLQRIVVEPAPVQGDAPTFSQA